LQAGADGLTEPVGVSYLQGAWPEMMLQKNCKQPHSNHGDCEDAETLKSGRLARAVVHDGKID